MNTRDKARELARYGRHGDSLLLHVHPIELNLLNWAARSIGHRGTTINPWTGMPEAFSFQDLIPIAAGVAGTVLSGGNPAVGALASGAASGAKTAAQGGTAQDALLSAGMSAGTGLLTGGTAPGVGDIAAQTAGQTAANTAAQAAGQEMAGKTAADMMAQSLGSAGQTAATDAASAAAANSMGGMPTGQMALQQFGSAPTDVGMMGATGTGATGGPLAAENAAIGSTVPKESLTPAMQTGMGMTPTTPAESTLWDKTKEFAGSKYALPAAMAGATLLGSAMEGGEEEEPGSFSPKGLKYTHREFTGPRGGGGRTGEKSYYKSTTREFARGRAIDMGADHGDGMADKTAAHIDGRQPAALSSGEYVIPADVVSGLGNGSSGAGVKVLDEFLRRVRKARTGGIGQAKKINPRKVMPK